MAPSKRNPTAGGGGVRETDYLPATAKVTSDDTDPALALQLKKLVRNWRIEPHIAALDVPRSRPRLGKVP